MDFTEVTQLIGSYGFPIICCLYMVYSNNKTKKDDNDTIKQLSEIVNENTTATKEAVQQLTNVMNQINTFLSTIIAKDGK